MRPRIPPAAGNRARGQARSARHLRDGRSRGRKLQHRSLSVQLVPGLDMTLTSNPACPADSPAPVQTAARSVSLRSNFSWMLTGNAIYALCQWGVLGMFARLGTPAVVGQFVLAMAVTAPIMAFFMLQFRMVQASDVRREYKFGHYLAVRLMALASAVVVILGVSACLDYQGETLMMIL